MLAKSPEQLLNEIHDLTQERMPMLRASVKGKQHFLDLTFTTDEERQHSEVVWILRAQIGTLDKIAGLFIRDGVYETYELIAIARNLFENLVWLRLFDLDQQYGLIFYDQLLSQQQQNTKRTIAKIESEIELFKEYEEMETVNFDAAYDSVLKGGDPTEEEIKQAQKKHEELSRQIDMRARRSFTLYAAAAQFNGYSYQSHLLRKDVVPKHQAILATVEANIKRLNDCKSVLLSPQMLKRSNERWNWRARAVDVEMAEQYDFLYSYTSKLLHSTPMNLITEKALSPSETLMMLEYASSFLRKWVQ